MNSKEPVRDGLSTDEDLVATFQDAPDSSEGRAAISEIFSRYETRIAAWCSRVLGARSDVADCTQEVLLKIYQRLEGFRGESRFSTWVYTTTRNTCLNWIRDRSSRDRVRFQDDEVFEVPDEAAPTVSARLEEEETRAQVRRILSETLTPEENQVMYLHFGQGLELSAITRLMGFENRSGAKAFVVSAKRKLKKKIGAFLAVDLAGQRERGSDNDDPADARPANPGPE